MNTEHRRGLGPIKSTHDRAATIAEMKVILGCNPSDADREYMRSLQAALDRYEQFCDDGCTRPDPLNMLRYQIEVVKRTTSEAVAKETGIADLDQLLHCERAFTERDVAILAEYFGIPQDQFME
jgi:antitoxin component HigA of HigAB toxin-antitoxin module